MAGVALVTGSCARVGAHIAARLADDGWRIALHSGHDRAPEPWLVERVGNAPVFVADLDDASAVDALPVRVAETLGQPVALLVNNASRFSALDEGAGFAELEQHLRTNMVAPVALALAVARGGARAVVNVLDQRIANPPRDQLAYTLSKQGLAEATRTLSIALAPTTRVNAVAPGLTLPTAEYGEGQLDRLAAAMPLARLPKPEDIADAVAWLAQASAVTGQTIFVDGGAHLRAFDRDFVHLDR